MNILAVAIEASDMILSVFCATDHFRVFHKLHVASRVCPRAHFQACLKPLGSGVARFRFVQRIVSSLHVSSLRSFESESADRPSTVCFVRVSPGLRDVYVIFAACYTLIQRHFN